MIKSNSTFDTCNETATKKPVWVVVFDSIGTYFSSGTFSGITSDYKKYLVNMNVIQVSTNMLNFRTELGGFEFEIIDKDGVVRALFSNNFSNRKVTAKIGFQELAIGNFLDLPEAYIVDFGVRHDCITYWFKCRNKLSQIKPIMGNVGNEYLQTDMDDVAEQITNSTVETAIPTMNSQALITTMGCVVARDNGQAHAGSWSVKLTGSTVTGQTEFETYFDGNATQQGLNAGRRYYISVWVYLVSGQDMDKISLLFDNSGGDTELDSTTTQDSWVELTGYVSDLTVHPLKIKAEDQNAAGNLFTEFCYVDDWSMTECIYITTASFSTGGSADWGSNTYVKIDNEIMGYGEKNGASYLGIITRAQLGTEIAEHKDGAKAYEIISVDEEHHGLTFLLGLLTTTAAGTNGNYDIGRAGWGLEIDDALIDINQILSEWGNYGKWGNDGANDNDFKLVRDSVNEVPDGLTWIERNLLKLWPAYFFITEDSTLGIKMWDVQGQNGGVKTLTTDDIIGNPSIEIRGNDIITHIEIKGDYNCGEGSWDDIQEYEQDQGYAIWGEKKRIQLQQTSSDEHWFGDTFARDRALERFFGRFGNPPVRAKMRTILEGQLVQIGDCVDITHTKTPLFRTQAQGWTREGHEVIAVNTDYRVAQIQPYIIAENILGFEEADIQDIHVFEEDDLDDATLSEDANHAAGTLQGADAYIDQSTYDATNVMIELELTLPDEGGGNVSRYITVYIKCQNPADTDIKEIEKRVYYDETASGKQKTQLYCLGMTSTTFARVRVDWTAHSGSHAPTALKVTQIKFWDFKGTTTTTELK